MGFQANQFGAMFPDVALALAQTLPRSVQSFQGCALLFNPFGFKAQIGFEEGIRRALDYFEEQISEAEPIARGLTG